MTYQEVLRQSETLSLDKQKNLIAYLVSKFTKSDKEKLIALFDFVSYKSATNSENKQKEISIETNLDELCGSAKGLWKEDAQVYITNLRKDDNRL